MSGSEFKRGDVVLYTETPYSILSRIAIVLEVGITMVMLVTLNTGQRTPAMRILLGTEKKIVPILNMLGMPSCIKVE
jgi:hypothetical protein